MKMEIPLKRKPAPPFEILIGKDDEETLKEIKNAYRRGYEEGAVEGILQGYKIGKQSGYDKGYEDGYDDGCMDMIDDEEEVLYG